MWVNDTDIAKVQDFLWKRVGEFARGDPARKPERLIRGGKRNRPEEAHGAIL